MINGSTSSYYDVEYAAGPMTIVAADGQNVEPIRVKRLRISTAETYDVLVPLSDGQSYELRASSIDGSGHSSLFVGEGEKVLAPDVPKPNPFLQSHRDMDMPMSDHSPMMHERGESASTPLDSKAMAVHEHSDMSMPMQAEVIEHMIDYSALMATHDTTLPERQQWREIELALTGNMERYVWSFNGKTATESPQILIRKGENVRFLMRNETMMHHPLHLHGHFFRVVN